MFKKEESIEILKILSLINNTEVYQKIYNHVWRKQHETKNYLIEEINQNESMSKKHKKVSKTLNYIKHLLILASKITGWVSISAFSSLVGIPIGITSSTIALKICAITAGIKRYKSKIKKRKKRKRSMKWHRNLNF